MAEDKLVVAGNGTFDDGSVQKTGTYVARYDAAGTPDPGFGRRGEAERVGACRHVRRLGSDEDSGRRKQPESEFTGPGHSAAPVR